MRFGVLGTGEVGQAIASKLVSVGHEVRMGSRKADNEKMADWVERSGERASGGTFADAAEFGDAVVNCTAGVTSIEALTAAGDENLAGKLLIDVANAVIVSGRIEAPALDRPNTDSLAERIQRTFPSAKVVKTLNTINCDVMVQPSLVPGEHVIFVSGDDDDAKARTVAMLGEFGWPAHRVIDLGDVASARGPEMYLALFSRLFLLYGLDAHFSIAIQRSTERHEAGALQ
ncbi:MAG TPA: NAD(P)-binding domain-containing protein [Pseudonocardiaceae bacterium]|nr:NAD(P)-binding domain-containing protein [Pseudonocardiaceae bacterium]